MSDGIPFSTRDIGWYMSGCGAGYLSALLWTHTLPPVVSDVSFGVFMTAAMVAGLSVTVREVTADE